eukprot:GHRQ01009880.1.p1 GENE.GHRQ01009880.1~~GHRQ01009880.1.p1  ORF type:complete len:360 (+),score=147.76 GHRQ01009880.1:56-1081(+)
MHSLASGSSVLRSGASCKPFAAPTSAGEATRRLILTQAKKKGGEKKGAQKKGGGALAELMKKKEEASQAGVAEGGPADGFASPEQYRDPEVVLQLMMICQSYKKQYNEFLMEVSFDTLAEAMYIAPFACLAHNKFEEGVEDPVFTYANKASLELFERTWDQMIGMPSRNSAEAAAQEDRTQVLEAAATGGSVQDYSGWRISKSGKRFRVKDLKLFNVTELDGTLWGQAAVFNQYELEDGTVVTVQGQAPPPSAIEIPPSQEEVDAAAAAVQEQAVAVRQLKEAQGLPNQDPQVQEAVAELQNRKQVLSELQAKFNAAVKEAEAAAAAPPTVDSWEDGEELK